MMRRFLCICFGIGALASLGMVLLAVPAAQQQVSAQGSLSSFPNNFQAAFAQAGSFCRHASAEISPRFQSFATASGAFVQSNATTARLQFEGMANSISFHSTIDTWLSGSKHDWSRGGAQVTAQAAGSQAIVLAGKIPVVSACKSDIEHLANLHRSLNPSASGL